MVALKLIWDPITVVETFVPNVVVEVADALAVVAAGVLIPTPVNVPNRRTSEMVAEYPVVSYVWLFPK